MVKVRKATIISENEEGKLRLPIGYILKSV